jgi:hypothetical protein
MTTDPAIEVIAEAWATIDDSLILFREDGDFRDGYMDDAAALVAHIRALGFLVVRAGTHAPDEEQAPYVAEPPA